MIDRIKHKRSVAAGRNMLQVLKRSSALTIAGWDNVGLSLMSVFQIMTLNGWSIAMYR